MTDYSYDATGNRLSQQIGNNPVTTYSYPAQSHRLIQVGAAVRSFDAAGNTLTGVPGYETDSATYDVRNRLTQVGSGSSAQLLSNYNGRGERVLVSQGAPAPELPTTSAAWRSSAGVRGYVYDESGQVISILIAGNPLRYEEIIWLDHTPIGRVESSTSAVTAVHVIHSDHLNTPRALANAQTQGGQPAGTVVWRWKLNQQTATGSNAFGAQPAEEDPDGNGTSVRFDLRFPGQQYDAATGLHYNYFRDYEPGTGRYVESDPVGLRAMPLS
jgi:RHS repeat-associated protein